MKRFLLSIIIYTLIPLSIYAQVVHVIQRGETIASIAANYGITEQALRSDNPALNTMNMGYVGLRLTIPIRNEESKATIENTSSSIAAFLEEAHNLINNKSYDKAIKVLSQALDIEKNGYTYYFRGFCYYQKEKWKKAINDLTIANISYDDYPNEVKEEINSLLVSAKENRQLQLQNRRMNWSSIGGALVMTSVMMTSSYLQAKQNSKMLVGRTISSDIDASSENSEGISSRSTSTSSGNKQSSGKLCTTCLGDGKCSQCHGSGHRTDNSFGTGTDPKVKCGICKGDGKCPKCGGIGRII